MAIVYYPQGAKIEERNTISGSKVVEVLNVLPDSIFYFDVTGSINSSSIIVPYTASCAVTASYVISASYSQTASYALNGAGGSGTTLETGSTYPITSSWAINSLTASLAIFSETSDYSLDSEFCLTASYALNGGGGSGTTLETGSFYPITSSWAINALTASYIDFVPITSISASWVSASVKITTSDTASYITALICILILL